VEAKYANGMLEVKVPAPKVATPKMIEVKAA
jgi:HSP20 family molecular chaperone IbpA